MPNFNLSQQPQYPIVTKDTDIALTNDQIQSLFCNEDSITLCVRSSSGHPNRAIISAYIKIMIIHFNLKQ